MRARGWERLDWNRPLDVPEEYWITAPIPEQVSNYSTMGEPMNPHSYQGATDSCGNKRQLVLFCFFLRV